MIDDVIGLIRSYGLSGVAIGNGAIDDAIQEASYSEYAYMHGLIPLGAKLYIDDIYQRCIENAATRHSYTPDEDPGASPCSCYRPVCCVNE